METHFLDNAQSIPGWLRAHVLLGPPHHPPTPGNFAFYLIVLDVGNMRYGYLEMGPFATQYILLGRRRQRGPQNLDSVIRIDIPFWRFLFRGNRHTHCFFAYLALNSYVALFDILRAGCLTGVGFRY